MSSHYREFRTPQRLRTVISCAWESHPADDRSVLIVPDGCVDLIWLGERELVIAGADSGPRRVLVGAGSRSTGVRLRPGAAASFLGLPAVEIRDQMLPAASVCGELADHLEPLLASSTPARRMELLVAAIERRTVAPDAMVLAAWERLGRGPTRVSELARELGVSERQLHRRVVATVGYGPKMLARVARLRRLIAVPEEALASRAFAAGYASQAHMSDEVRELTGTTAVRFLEDALLTAA